MSPDHLVHPDREREIVRRKLEQRIAADVDFVEEDSWQERWQAEWLPVRNEVDFVSTIGQSDAQLRRNGARSAVRRITGDANVHSALSHHSRATALARESSGFTCVTAAAGSWCLSQVRWRFAYCRVSIMTRSFADDKSRLPSTC